MAFFVRTHKKMGLSPLELLKFVRTHKFRGVWPLVGVCAVPPGVQYDTMAGERILIVDDTPVNLKLTRILLVNEGYKVLTAASAEEALEVVRSHHPDLVLADIQLPGMDGLDLARRIKQTAATRDIAVVDVTAFAMAGDEGRALDAGCDGYITKPIDTRTLAARIREILERRTEQRGAEDLDSAGAGSASDAAAELAALRRRFLREGLSASRQLLLDLERRFDAAEAARKLHNWVGTGGLLGFAVISRQAREVETLVQTPPVDIAPLREALTSLVLAFSKPEVPREETVQEPILQALSGKKIAVVGFPRAELERLVAALERARAIPVCLESSAPPDPEALRECVLAAVHVGAGSAGSRWLTPAVPGMGDRPVVLAGMRDHLLSLPRSAQGMAREFLMDSWLPEEALVRLTLALSPHPKSSGGGSAAAAAAPIVVQGRVRVVVADDDPTVLLLVRTALRNFGMDCECAPDGPRALEAIRQGRPHAAVLDINMPGMDGFAVLSEIRREGLPLRVLLLTARQQESDVIRGFALGADDYVVKPFSPAELVARLKRLLGR